jgi:hypothetical protein
MIDGANGFDGWIYRFRQRTFGAQVESENFRKGDERGLE